MATAGVLFGWKEPRSGREGLAGELFTTSMGFYQSKVDDGTLESFEPVILRRHGGDLNGFFLLRGEADKLDAFTRSDEFLDLILKATHCLDGLGIVDAYVGDGVASLITKWAQAIPQ